MTVKAGEETMTNALNPKMEEADIAKTPVTFFAAVIRARGVPNGKLCVDTNKMLTSYRNT
jgi:hypothetical protein